MKHFAYFVAGVILASLTQALVPPAQALPSLDEMVAKDRA